MNQYALDDDGAYHGDAALNYGRAGELKSRFRSRKQCYYLNCANCGVERRLRFYAPDEPMFAHDEQPKEISKFHWINFHAAMKEIGWQYDRAGSKNRLLGNVFYCPKCLGRK